MDRNLPPSLVLESVFTREVVWGINVGGLAVPLVLLASGALGAWLVWKGVGVSSYWSIAGFAALAPGTLFTLSLLPAFRRGHSLLLGLGAITIFGLVAAGLVILFLAIFVFNKSFG